jgi:hypothetical protein
VGGLASSATTGLVLSAVASWVSDGASFVLRETAAVLNQTTAPRLGSAWFSATYWKVAGIATVLTLPFLFAASVQALLRSDITLLLRSAFGYLPLAMLVVAIAAPVTMLLLSASDELAAAVSSAAGGQGANFFAQAVASLGAVGGASGSPFVAFLLGIFTVAGALFLWVELLMREAAVYVVVLMLPLAFAAFVWPARRIWAIRTIEVLAALILSKFAIVAVLSLGAAALSNSVHGGLPGLLAGIVLLILGAFTPWALLRLLPLAEVASSTAGALRGQAEVALRTLPGADPQGSEIERWIKAMARTRHAAGGPAAAETQPQIPDTEPVAAPTEAAPAQMSASPSEAPSSNDASAEPAAPEARTTAAEPAAEHVQDVAHLPDTGPYPADESGA